MVFTMCFTFQPLSMNSTASQSSNAAWAGHSPCAPTSSIAALMPVPKNCRHILFMKTRAVSGFSREVNQRARSRRVSRAASPFGCGRKCGTSGFTMSPLSFCQLPRGSTRIVYGSCASVIMV